MSTENQEYEQLFKELTQYEKEGVRIKMDELSASPMQIVSAHLIKEEVTYMRDYIIGKDGKIEELCFYSVKKETI